MIKEIMIMRFSAFFLFCSILIALPANVFGAIIHVPADHSTIQDAIDMAAHDDTVLVAAGTYYEIIDFKGKNIALRSEDGPETTVIDGGRTATVVTFQNNESGGAVLQGFQIRNGLPSRFFGLGGGIFISNASPVISDCMITKNGAANGGGIFVQGSMSAPRIENNLIFENIATEMGGGIEARDGCTAKILGNKITENVSMNGSAIFVSDAAHPVIENNVIKNNNGGCDLGYTFDAEDYLDGIDVTARIGCGDRLPGAVFIADHSRPLVRNNIIESNIGGGMGVFLGSAPLVQNNIIRTNYANRLLASGIMIAFEAAPILIGNSITDNQFGAIWIDDTSIILDEDQTPISLAGYDIIEDTNDAFKFLGNWSFNISDDCSGGTCRYASGMGDTATVRFNGTGVSLIYFAWNNNGKAGVNIDGIQYDPVEMYVDGKRRLGRTEKLIAKDLSPGEHILEVKMTGEKNPLSTWTGINVDSVGVLPSESVGSNLVLGSVWVRQPFSLANPGTQSGSGKTLRIPVDYTTIQAAIDAAGDGDTIIVAPGTYSENIDFMGKGITLTSQNPDDLEMVKTTIIQAENQGQPAIVFARNEDRGAKLEGFTILNQKGGKGILVGSASPVIKKNIIRDCPESGIVCNYSPAPLIMQNTIVNNATATGSGIKCFHSAPEIKNNTISDNSGDGISSYFAWPVVVGNSISNSKSRSGIFLDHFSIATIINNSIYDNKVLLGGIYLDFFSNSTIDGNIITDNQSRGIFMIDDCSPLISNNILARNVTGLIASLSRPRLINNTIVDNSNQGIYLADMARATIKNTILWNSYNEIGSYEFPSVQVTHSLLEGGWVGEGNLSQNPLFANNSYQLNENSPCIDAGTSDDAPGSDVEGKARPKGNGYDIGAYEWGTELNIDEDSDYFSTAQEDCNDSDDTIYPGAIEICGDGIDQDCDGSDSACTVSPKDTDNDEDGYTENEGDCDDSNATIYPGAVDTCGDGIDQDCDGSDALCPSVDDGYNVTSELWAKAILEVTGNPVTMVWKMVGADITPSGDQVISGYFYAAPSDFLYGSLYNPEVFVKVYIATNGWCNMAFNHVTVDRVSVYTAHNDPGSPSQTGMVTLSNRLVEHQYTGVAIDDTLKTTGETPATSSGDGYTLSSGLWAKAVLQPSTGTVNLIWKEVGTDTTPSGDQVVSGYFYASPEDFPYGSLYNPEVFVKVYIASNGWANMAFNHVTVDDLGIMSAHNFTGSADQSGTATLSGRLVENQYDGVSLQ